MKWVFVWYYITSNKPSLDHFYAIILSNSFFVKQFDCIVIKSVLIHCLFSVVLQFYI